MQFPFGNAAFALLLVAVTTGAGVALRQAFAARAERPDLVFATFTKEHAEAYKSAVAEFEKKHGVRVQVQVVDQRALTGRLQSAMQVGAEVPDMVELLTGTMGTFTRGPLEGVGFVDLTDRVREAGLDKTLVPSRFGMWSSRGRLFALPHDVHPVMLAYRRDLAEQLGIDVSKLTTWDEFVRVGRDVTRDLNGDGVPDRYMIDLPAEGGDALRLLMLQRGARLFDEAGNVAFDDPVAAEMICWYVRQTVRRPGNDQRIAFPAGWGQTLARSMLDGLCLFYICPDWRTMQFQSDVPGLKGKMGLIPLPVWEPGGRRTSMWGGTGLAITKQCKQPELAWQLAMHLYYDPAELGKRFAETNILPPLTTAWTRPEFDEPSAFYSGIALGRAYAELAPEVPDEPSHTYMNSANGKLSEAFQNVALRYAEQGDAGLEEYARAELKRCADRVRAIVGRNAFLRESAEKAEAAR